MFYLFLAVAAAAQAAPVTKLRNPTIPTFEAPSGRRRPPVVPPPPVQISDHARPRAPLTSYISNDNDYPASALREREEGTTMFRLRIGPDGRVTNCTVLVSSGSRGIDGATCRIMRQRARFTPARDVTGNSTSDDFLSEIAWRLPRG